MRNTRKNQEIIAALIGLGFIALILVLVGSAQDRVMRRPMYAACAGYGSPAIWFKGDAIVGLADGDPVSTWSDSSGNSVDVTQASTARPLYQTGEANSLPVVEFDGVNDFLTKSTISTYSQPNTLFVVHKQASVGGTAAYLFEGYYVTSNRNGLYCDATTGYLGAYAGSVLASTTPCSTSTYEVLEVLYNGASSQIWINGTSAVSGAAGAQNLGGNLYIGGDIALASYYYAGKIAEIIYYNSDVGSTNRSLYRQCLGSKYAITVAP